MNVPRRVRHGSSSPCIPTRPSRRLNPRGCSQRTARVHTGCRPPEARLPARASCTPQTPTRLTSSPFWPAERALCPFVDRSLPRTPRSVRTSSRTAAGMAMRYIHCFRLVSTHCVVSQGYEYWFPRPVKTVDDRPLIILGGGREAALPPSEAYVDDDTTCHPDVGTRLRTFLPAVFEGKFEPGRDPEMEWVCICMHICVCAHSLWHFLDGHHGLYRDQRPIRTYGRPPDVASACSRANGRCPQVGPIDRLPMIRDDAAQYSGQFIAAGYSGHGVPRAFTWYAFSFIDNVPGKRSRPFRPQRRSCRAYDHVRADGYSVDAT